MKEEKKRVRNAISALIISIILAIVVIVINYIQTANKITIEPDLLKPLITQSDINDMNSAINSKQSVTVKKPNTPLLSKEINKSGTKTSVVDINQLKNQINQPKLQ